MKNNIWWTVAIQNAVNVICFTALAIAFNKWWIVLFSILFVSYVQTETNRIHKYFRTCDKCGKRSEYADSYNEALDKAKEAGWMHVVDGNKDYCPECINKE